MIGTEVTIRRVVKRVLPNYRTRTEVFTVVGEVTDMTESPDGSVTGICVRGTRSETGEYRHSWYAVCPYGCTHDAAARAAKGHRCAMAGSMTAEESMIVNACGCAVASMCACDMGAVRA